MNKSEVMRIIKSDKKYIVTRRAENEFFGNYTIHIREGRIFHFSSNSLEFMDGHVHVIPYKKIIKIEEVKNVRS